MSTVVERYRRATPEARFLGAAAALLTVALAVRVGYVLHTSNFMPVQDGKSYNYLASGLAQGQGWVLGTSAFRPPGYPFFLAGVYSIVGVPHNTWAAARIVEAVLATVTVGLVGLLALQVAGRTAMLITLAIAAVYVPFVLVGESLMTEVLFVPLILAATNCAVRSRTAVPRRRWVLATGLLAGLAALTRGNGIVVGLALAFVVWTGTPRMSWRAIAAPATLLAVMVLTIMPWTIRNAIAQHAFVPVTTELGSTLKGTYNDRSAKQDFRWWGHGYPNYRKIMQNPRLTEAQRDSQLLSAVADYVVQHPTYVPQAFFWNTLRLLDLQGRDLSRLTARTDVYATAAAADLGVYNFWLIGILAILGCFTLAARRVPRVLWVVPLLIWITEAPVTTGTPRFRAALDPFVILLAAFGVQAIAMAVMRRAKTAPGRPEGDPTNTDPTPVAA
jgi:4-amino-4-deoxy-L-arabinose transferase-like glycosyltransferase